jgi:putative oxidoreductase
LLKSFGKANDPAGFFESIRIYRIIEGRLAGWVVWALIRLEIVGASAILIRPLRKGAILLLAPLLLHFTLAGISAKLRGIEIPCGCFGVLDQSAPFGWSSILRNLALVALLMGAWVLEARAKGNASDPACQ